MKDKVRKFVDHLFADIHETKQLQELKEEIGANLLEKISDFMGEGNSREVAFNKAVSSLGDMGELIDSLRRASEDKMKENASEPVIDRQHVIGYISASIILLVGFMVSGMVYLKMKDLLMTAGILIPFLLPATGLFVYFGLTQESLHEYGMKPKRALAYSLATVVALIGVLAGGYLYFEGAELFSVVAVGMPFIIVAAPVFIYLGLTEKSRVKMNSHWRNHWIEYYSNPETMMVRGSMSGALWILSVAGFFVLGFTVGWRYAWIIFIFAVGIEALMEAVFAARRRK